MTADRLIGELAWYSEPGNGDDPDFSDDVMIEVMEGDEPKGTIQLAVDHDGGRYYLKVDVNDLLRATVAAISS